MKRDEYGQVYYTVDDLFELLYKNPDLDLSRYIVENPDKFNQAVQSLHAEISPLRSYHSLFFERDAFSTVEEYDQQNQTVWYMPSEYINLDIENYLFGLCKNEKQKQRVQQELELYKERNLLPLLQYLKYFVDTLRKNKIVWGVGRGSSVASYVLYLIGVHKIDSIKFNLDIAEFLK